MISLAGGAYVPLLTLGGHVAFDLAKHKTFVKETVAYWALNAAQFLIGPVSLGPNQAW